MIRLKRSSRPPELTEEVIKALTDEYKNDNSKAVWRKPYIVKTLLEMSHGKCSYCEVKLGEEGKYMQVDHYHHKKMYPDEVVKWENLIPSCNRCNSQKSTHDTYLEPIVNPFDYNPKDYLYMENYRIKSRGNNKIGQDTINVLCLNDSEGLVLPRFNIGNAVQEKVQDIKELLSQYNDKQTVIKKNKIISMVKGLLREARLDSEYAALVATVLMQDETYLEVKESLTKISLWDDEMQALHDNANSIALLK